MIRGEENILLESCNTKCQKRKAKIFREISKNCLRMNQKEITIRYIDLHEAFKCRINIAKHMNESSPNEKYMIEGWYDFVKTIGFRNGDTLVCQMSPFSPYMYVTLQKK
ncbi:hypothetical protein RYX36_014279 [Vicia faba]